MISNEQIQAIANTINQAGVSDETVSLLRQSHSPMHFTYCMDDDLPNHTPVLEQEAFNLYLIDGRDHCMCLTSDLANATGVVVAEIIPE